LLLVVFAAQKSSVVARAIALPACCAALHETLLALYSFSTNPRLSAIALKFR